MIEKKYETGLGDIHYFINDFQENKITLVFLPGLTADHNLFEKQVSAFEDRYNVMVWDAPGHGNSRPFELEFTLADKARWLHEILTIERISKPVLVGQSMGGYVSQAFMELYPDDIRGFISIDSAPLQREYMSKAEIWMLKIVEPIYRWYPWKALLRDGANGVATTQYGRELMKKMMISYDHLYYSKLAGHGYKMIAEAIEKDLPYKISCPFVLVCGEKDVAGSTKSYNRKWGEKLKVSVRWIKGAGHNSNTDSPNEINIIIEDFINTI